MTTCEAASSTVHVPSTPPVSKPLSLIVPLALDLLVEKAKENTGERSVIVSTLLDTEAHTPLKVSLMKRAKLSRNRRLGQAQLPTSGRDRAFFRNDPKVEKAMIIEPGHTLMIHLKNLCFNSLFSIFK